VVTGQHVATLPAPGGLCQADGSISSTPTGTRTPVPWLRTKYPRPLDDGGNSRRFIISHRAGESSLRRIVNRPPPPAVIRRCSRVVTARSRIRQRFDLFNRPVRTTLS